MEAANLGCYLAGSHVARGHRRRGRPGRGPVVPALGRRVAAARPRRRSVVAEPHDSLGIPTWHYGHEPSNVFATGIAKYFRNATREAILLEVCDAGIVFLPGAGGTVQEVFQDACENYYADESSVAEMVLVGRDVLDRDPARLAAAPARWPAAARWRTASTSSTTSTRRWTCWGVAPDPGGCRRRPGARWRRRHARDWASSKGRQRRQRVIWAASAPRGSGATPRLRRPSRSPSSCGDLAVVLDERLVDRLPRAALDRTSRGAPHPAAELRVAGQPVDVPPRSSPSPGS